MDILKRIGNFQISAELIKGNPHLCAEILKNMVIVRAEQLFYSNVIDYIAFSDQFDEVDEGCTAPFYFLIMGQTEHTDEETQKTIYVPTFQHFERIKP